MTKQEMIDQAIIRRSINDTMDVLNEEIAAAERRFAEHPVNADVDVEIYCTIDTLHEDDGAIEMTFWAIARSKDGEQVGEAMLDSSRLIGLSRSQLAREIREDIGDVSKSLAQNLESAVPA